MPGDIKYKDINNDGIINDEDIVPIDFTNLQKLYTASECRWDKNFDISCFFQGAAVARSSSLLIPKQRILSCKWISEETTSMVADASIWMITGLNRIVIYTLLSQDCQLLTLQTITTETVHGGYATVPTCV